MVIIITITWIAFVKVTLPHVEIYTFYGLLSYLYWSYFLVTLTFYGCWINLFSSVGRPVKKSVGDIIGKQLNDELKMYNSRKRDREKPRFKNR